MRKLVRMAIVSGAAVCLVVAGGGSASAAQGGISGFGLPSHAWFKVGRAELNQKGGAAACASTGLSKWNCGPLVNAVNDQKRRNPNANGYWAEFYVTGKVRSGTW